MPIFNTEYKSFNPLFIYEYNFVGKTTSQMEADGWVFYLNKNYATFNSNWINTTWQDKPPLAWIDNISSVISTAKKITISSTWNFIYKFRSEVYLYNSFSSWRYTNAYWQGISLAENSIGVMINNNSIPTGRTPSWIITQTTVFDLENLTWSGTATNGYSNSWTLTSSDVTNIRNLKWIWISPSWGWGGNSSWWMTSISLEIEY